MEKLFAVASSTFLVWLVALFAYTSTLKLADPHARHRLNTQALLPGWARGPVAAGVPYVELGVALLLVLALTRAVGAVAALALGIAFAGYAVVAVRRATAGSCGCAGDFRPRVWADRRLRAASLSRSARSAFSPRPR